MRNLRKIEKPLALLSFLCLFPAGMSAQSIVKGELQIQVVNLSLVQQ